MSIDGGPGLSRREQNKPVDVDTAQAEAVNPLLLGSGERLLDAFQAGTPALKPERVLETPGAVHIRYRVIR